ncbi:MAG: DEAD/DEAH box helicase, partial [Polaromonas sp.]
APPSPAQLEAEARQADERARQATHGKVDQWLDLFDSADGLEHTDKTGTSQRSAEQFVYLLHRRKQGHQEVLVLGFATSRPLRKGGWAKVKIPRYVPYEGLPVYDQASSDDLETLRLIIAQGRSTYASFEGVLVGQSGQLALQLAASTGRLFAADSDARLERPLTQGAPRPIEWQWHEVTQPRMSESAWALRPRLADVAPGVTLFTNTPALYLDLAQGQCGLAETPGISQAHLALLLTAPPIPQSAFEHHETTLLRRLAGLPLPPMVKPPEVLRGIAPTAHLHLSPVEASEVPRLGLLRAVLQFDYAGLRQHWPHHHGQVVVDQAGDATMAATAAQATHAGPKRWLLHRDLPAELAAQSRLHSLGLHDAIPGHYHLPGGGSQQAWLSWADDDFAPLRQAGLTVSVDERLHNWIRRADTLAVTLQGDASPHEGADDSAPSPWFDLSLGMEINGQRHNILPWLPELLAQLKASSLEAELPPFVYVKQLEGGYVRLPTEPLRPWLQALLDLVSGRGGDFDGDSLRLTRLEALRVGAALGQGAVWQGAESLQQMVQQLAGHSALPQAPLPPGLQARLRPYQQQGLNWLQFLRQHALSGILADDMGLGKTLQTLAHVLVEKEAGRLTHPALIVAPVSLMGNWRREAERFTPGLRTLVLHGKERHDAAAEMATHDLVIAPYSLLQRDRERWLEQPWHLVVLDEAQNIKNASTHAAQVASELQARHRLCLSGTPMENHLGELWSLFHFLMPGFLGSQTLFKELFRTPIEKHGDSQRLDQLRRRVTPFMLRRTKREVATELPDKIEAVSSIELSGKQADLYETIRLSTEKAVQEALANKGLAKSQIQILDALLKLRQVCCDPRLLPLASAKKIQQSAKLEHLMELLPEMLAEGRRVLLFSQFTTMLTLIEDELKARAIPWVKLTGQSQKRDALIERFTSGEVPLFLISLKAGGVGLNLPQADTVIHYDPWWNPAAENQATDRAHRIGQQNQVFAYKLVAQGTIEERILALQERKAALAESMYSGSQARKQPLFTESDVAELLKPLG